MTGSVTFYFTMQWALSCSHSYYYTEFGYLLLWEDGMACPGHKCLQRINVRVKSSAVAA